MMFSTFVARSSPLMAAVSRGGHQKTLVIRCASSMATLGNTKKNEDQHPSKQCRELHSSSKRQADAVTSTDTSVESQQQQVIQAATESTSTLMDRFVLTAEVTVSKIFPAGFGWQTASVVAGNWGYAADSLNFAVTTGLGDALGVFGGHMLYYTAKKEALGDKDIDLIKELHTGILLGSAAFCSGTAWQPIVNALQGAELPFNQVFLGTWAGCGLAFYLGLRVGRTILSGPLYYVQEPTYENKKTDVSLSFAIGGATGFFVGTDAAYLPEQNWLIHAVGIKAGTPDWVGSCIAGSSTAMGFLAAQSTLNTLYPAGKLWTD